MNNFEDFRKLTKKEIRNAKNKFRYMFIMFIKPVKEIIIPVIFMYVSFNASNLIVTPFLFIMVQILLNVIKRAYELNMNVYRVPRRKERYTKIDENGNILVNPNDIDAALVYLSELETYLETKEIKIKK